MSLLKTAQSHPMLVELKSGETYNGHLINCDSWMNVHLREVIYTSKDGDRFYKIPEIYLRGTSVKFIRIPDEVIDLVKEETKEFRRQQKENKKFKKQVQRTQPQANGDAKGGQMKAGQKRKAA